MKKVFFGLLMVLVLSACSGGMMGGEDKFSTSYVESHIVKGKTTQQEVQRLYGVPDTNEKSSNGVTWVYRKSGNLSDASSLTGYIPGTGAISSALGLAGAANSASSQANKVSGKMSGNTEIHGDRFYVTFDNNNIVDYWSLN
ncbi:membrane lipoprotein lipid attachment site-containing protein [Acerihabitans arboris]|uniref:Type IV secretion system putative lipoprotein virB7 n=1 Tax=Acerihabitans arboris TaxID=2691583 RepID=A0A845SFP0_9GAMM|nr:membrane lipoprotein lipid attachment site-containing protein [Acerihabitans arboris]NDL61896.1 lipoprotein [Acerihabitans arboris]